VARGVLRRAGANAQRRGALRRSFFQLIGLIAGAGTTRL
jgi:hypothetical protein